MVEIEAVAGPSKGKWRELMGEDLKIKVRLDILIISSASSSAD
jgi:hypothetical protein